MKSWRSLTWSIVSCAWAATGVSLHAQSSEDTVELPKYTVTDSRLVVEKEPWHYTTIEGFEIVSNASVAATQGLVRDFELFRIAQSVAWPIKTKPLPPSGIVITAKRNEFDKFLPPSQRGNNQRSVTLSLYNREQAFIVLDYQAKIVLANPLSRSGNAGEDSINQTDPDFTPINQETALGDNGFTRTVDHNRQLFYAYIQYLLKQTPEPTPIWYREGIAQILMRMKMDKFGITFGLLDDPNEASALAAANSRNSAAQNAFVRNDPTNTASATRGVASFGLEGQQLLSFSDFFGVSAADAVTKNEMGDNLWQKQCYAFTHLCLFGLQGKYKKNFEQFLARSMKEPATESLFTECFGLTYKDMKVIIRSYADRPTYKHTEHRIKGKEKFNLPIPELRDATEAEYARIKGDALRLAGFGEAGREALIAAYARGSRDPQLLATLGQSELDANDPTRAKKFLEAAVKNKTSRASAYRDLAALRLADALTAPQGTKGKLSNTQLKSVLSLIETCRTLSPDSPSNYLIYGRALYAYEIPPIPEDFAYLAQGLGLYPSDEELVYITAALNLRAKNLDGARALSSYGLRITQENPTFQAKFQRLLDSLPAAKPAPAP